MTDNPLVTSNILGMLVELERFWDWQIPAEFETKRVEINLGILDAIESPIASNYFPGGCTCGAQLAGRYLRNLQSCELWPLAKELRRASISTILSRMQSLEEPNVNPSESIYCSCKNGELESEREFAKWERTYLEHKDRPLFGLHEKWKRIASEKWLPHRASLRTRRRQKEESRTDRLEIQKLITLDRIKNMYIST